MQVQQEVFNEALPNSQEKGYSAIYRQKGIKTLIERPEPHLRTVRDVLVNTRDKYGHKAGLGEILVTKDQDAEGKEIERRQVLDHNYRHIYDQAYRLGKAIRDRDLAFKEKEHGMKLIGIYSQNRMEWYVTDWACALFGYTVSPLYDTLGKENLHYCIELCGLTTLFVSAKTAGELVKFHQTGSLRTVVTFDELTPEIKDKLKEAGLEVLSYWQLIEEGLKSKTTNEDIEIKGSDFYTFCYTSGTTGPPKGALITNDNMMACITGLYVHKDIRVSSEDSYLSTLPLPHLMERAMSMTMFYAGGFLVCGSGNMMKLKEDNAAIKATILVSVPRLYNRIADSLKAAVEDLIKGDENKRAAMEGAVFQKCRQSFGGKIRLLITGSAPIHPNIQEYLQRAFASPFLQGYGQTESPVALLLSRRSDKNFGMIQEIATGVELRLQNIPEMKYTAEDRDSEGRPTPRGEICARGPQIFHGYYKRPELTAQAIEDGWLHTGDVGEITPDLCFKIIDRKKNIFKLQQGQYVAPDKVEQVYLKFRIVDEIFLHGDSKHNFAVAIAVVGPQKVAEVAKEIGIQGTPEEVRQRYEVRAALLKRLNERAREQGLASFMLAKNIYIEFQPFLARGILTNTMKLIRFAGRQLYQGQIEAMYLEGELKA